MWKASAPLAKLISTQNPMAAGRQTLGAATEPWQRGPQAQAFNFSKEESQSSGHISSGELTRYWQN